MKFNTQEAKAVNILLEYARRGHKPVEADVEYDETARLSILAECEHAAHHCGGGEDLLGAILYTGAARECFPADNPGRNIDDDQIVALAQKLEAR